MASRAGLRREEMSDVNAAEMMQQLLGGGAAAPTRGPSIVTLFVIERLHAVMQGTYWIFETVTNTLQATVYHLPTVLFSSGFAFGLNECLRAYSPKLIASKQSALVGSYKVALFVGAAFLTKAVLERFVETALPERYDLRREQKIYATFVRYTTPLVVTLVYAYLWERKVQAEGVKLVEAAIGTTLIFGLTHFLERGLKYSLNVRGIRWVIDKVYD